MTKPRSSKRHASPSRFPRTARINEVLREVIATELEKSSDEDERLELVTITGVETDPDLKRAKVFFSCLDTKATEEQVIDALNGLRVEIQATIAKSVRMKNTPQLMFIVDSAINEGQKIEDILRGIKTTAPSPDEEDTP